MIFKMDICMVSVHPFRFSMKLLPAVAATGVNKRAGSVKPEALADYDSPIFPAQ